MVSHILFFSLLFFPSRHRRLFSLRLPLTPEFVCAAAQTPQLRCLQQSHAHSFPGGFYSFFRLRRAGTSLAAREFHVGLRPIQGTDRVAFGMQAYLPLSSAFFNSRIRLRCRADAAASLLTILSLIRPVKTNACYAGACFPCGLITYFSSRRSPPFWRR